jgi:hypothetical protein
MSIKSGGFGVRIRSLSCVAAPLIILALSACSKSQCSSDESDIHLVEAVAVPGNPLDAFDVSWADAASQRLYLADRGNAGVEVIDTASGKFLRRIGGFAGDADHDHSGPNGVVLVPERNELWAGDGDSSVKIISLGDDSAVSVSTGGNARADELSYDPDDELVLVVNNAEATTDGSNGHFATLISTAAGHDVIARIPFAEASAGLEQSVWDSSSQRFYLAVPELDGDPSRGAVAVIDPDAAAVVATYPVSECEPAGLALGPEGHLLLGCSGDAIEAGFPAKSVIMDLRDGRIVNEIMEIGGSDEVWFNPGDNSYYLAARDDPRGPALGVIDAGTNTFESRTATSADAKSVAVDAASNRAFVALTPDPAGATLLDASCANGCIGVYARGDTCEP